MDSMAYHAATENGSAASELRTDAHDCIMVRVLGPTEYKVVARWIRARTRAPSDRLLLTEPDCIRWCSRARNFQGQALRVVAEEATSLDSSCARQLAAVAGRDEETRFQIEQRNRRRKKDGPLC